MHLQLSVPFKYIPDGFDSDAYREHYMCLKEKMDPDVVRGLCFQEKLISRAQRQRLAEIKGRADYHNEYLLECLEKGPPHTFATFCDKILAKDETGKFRAVLESFRAR